MAIRDVFYRILNWFGIGPKLAKSVEAEDWAENGTWLHTIRGGSTYVSAVRYDRHNKFLAVQFTTGGRATYPHIDISVAMEMVRAPSLGRFVRQKLYHLPYLERYRVVEFATGRRSSYPNVFPNIEEST